MNRFRPLLILGWNTGAIQHLSGMKDHINALTDKYNFVTKATFVLNHKIKSVYPIRKFQPIK